MNEENKKLGNSFKFTQKGLERRLYQKAGIKRQQFWENNNKYKRMFPFHI